MDTLRDLLENRVQELRTIKERLEKELKKAPEGSLRISSSRGRTQYYYRRNQSDRRGNYIREIELACALAQKNYDQRVMDSILQEEQAIRAMLDRYPTILAEEIYEELSESRKKLVIPVRETDEQFLEKWKSMPFQGKSFSEEDPEFITDKGERVRSKSEIIIANLLAKESIPYRYECPLRLRNGLVIYPDFTILDLKNRKEYYWEHQGMMDDPEYAAKAIRKIRTYNTNGFYQGTNLIISSETKNEPLNMRHIKELIKHYFL